MRKTKAQIKEQTEIDAILEKAPALRLALAGADGWPYIVPLSFAYEPGRIYVHTGFKGKKMDILEQNNKVCFEVDMDVEVIEGPQPCEWGCHYSSVVGQGRAVVVKDEAEKINGLNALMKKYAGRQFEFPPEKLRMAAVLRIDIDSLTGRREA